MIFAGWSSVQRFVAWPDFHRLSKSDMSVRLSAVCLTVGLACTIEPSSLVPAASGIGSGCQVADCHECHASSMNCVTCNSVSPLCRHVAQLRQALQPAGSCLACL